MEVPIGRHVTAALDAQRAGVARDVVRVQSVTGNAWESGVHQVLPPRRWDVPEERQVYEQIGVLYTHLEHCRDGGDRGDELADFLDNVLHALLRPDGPTALAVRRAITRYEHDRTGA